MADAFRWTHEKPLSRPGDETVVQGEVFNATEAEQRAFDDRIAPAADAADAADELGEVDDSPLPPFDPAQYSTRELREKINGAGYSYEEFSALAEAEKAGKDRSTALNILAP